MERDPDTRWRRILSGLDRPDGLTAAADEDARCRLARDVLRKSIQLGLLEGDPRAIRPGPAERTSPWR